MFDHEDLRAAFKAAAFDNQAEALIYTQNRDLIFKGSDNKQVFIPCNPIHAQLKLAENAARKRLLNNYPQYGGNLATANIGFVTSSHPYDPATKTHARRFITIPLHYAVDWNVSDSKHHFTAQIKDFWGDDAKKVLTPTKAGNSRKITRNYNQLIRQKRANSVASHDGVHYNHHCYENYNFDKHYASAGPSLEQDFHHSEQTIYEMLEKPEVIHYYINNFLQAYNVQPGDKIYAIILDIYTTRYMCQGCAARSYSTAHYPGRSLLAKWEWKLKKMGYHIPKVGLRMAVRATGEGPAKNQTKLNPVQYQIFAQQWTLNPGRGNVNSIVLEADAEHINFAPLTPINDLFRRTVFLSREGGKTASGDIQEAAIDSFADFLTRYTAATYTQFSCVYNQCRPTDVIAQRHKASLLPRLHHAVPVNPIQRKQLAQNIYLPGQATSLTDQEFKGLYFI